jgi:hypothetical protein
MSPDELRLIVDKGFGELGMSVVELIRERTVRLSQGFPHCTHLLGKYCAIEAIKGRHLQVTSADFQLAVESAIEDTFESIRSAYQMATLTTRTETIFPAVLLAAAIADEDEHGTFRATDLVDPLRTITALSASTSHQSPTLPSRSCEPGMRRRMDRRYGARAWPSSTRWSTTPGRR